MPYIEPGTRRADIDASTAMLDRPNSPGELNYVITRIVDRYLVEQGVAYGSLNAAIGVLEAAKLELYRRIVAPYEDTKLAKNGDVYRSLPKPPADDEDSGRWR